MRKVILWLMLTVMIFAVGIPVAFAAEPDVDLAQGEVSTYKFIDFGLYREVKPNKSVIINPDGQSDYEGITYLKGSDYFFAGKISGDAPNGNSPYGTLTVSSGDSNYEGQHYQLRPSFSYSFGAEKFYRYYLNVNIDNLYGNKVFWNLYTSPDVTVGNATLPSKSAENRKIALSESVPNVKIIPESNNSSKIKSIRISFVKFDDRTPVNNPDISKIYVTISGDKQKTETLTNLTGSHDIELNYEESSLKGVTVQYEKNHELCTWTFEPLDGNYSSIEWGELSKPLILKSNDKKTIEIKLPLSFSFGKDESGSLSYPASIIRIANPEVVSIDYESVEFSEGSNNWNGSSFDMKKGILSFDIIAYNIGRTAIVISLPDGKDYYREVNVTDDNEKIPSSRNYEVELHAAAVSHKSRARFVNGRPYYNSAEFAGIELALVKPITFSCNIESGEEKILVKSGDVSNGIIGIKNASTSSLYEFQSSDEGYKIIGGVKFDSSDASNTASSQILLNDENLEGYQIWLDSSEISRDFVSELYKLSDVLSSDFMTTQKQLENCVPYFNLENNTLSWSFVKADRLEKVTLPSIKGAITYRDGDTLKSQDISADSGSISGVNNPSEITFEYTSEGVSYSWTFEPMDKADYVYRNTSYSESSPLLPYVDTYYLVGASRDIAVTLYKIDDFNGIDILIHSTDIINVTPAHFDTDAVISFSLKALKLGTTDFSMVFSRNDYGTYDKYAEVTQIISVYTPSSAPIVSVDSSSSDLHATVSPTTHRASIVEGRPNYYDATDTVEITIRRDKALFFNNYNENYNDNLTGTLYIYSGDKLVDSKDLDPTFTTDWDINNRWGYIPLYTVQVEPGTRIVWEFPNSMHLNNTGSFDVPPYRTTKTQLNTYKPYVKLKRDGLNVVSLDWYFADSADAKISKPEGISSIDVEVSGRKYFKASGDSGTIMLGIPEVLISRITFTFTENGTKYTWEFYPVDGTSGYWWGALEWDIDSPDLPLVMRKGQAKEVTLISRRYGTLKPFIGNSSIVSMDEIPSSDGDVKVKLTALSAGMTSITLASTNSDFVASPREIWVFESNDATGKNEIPNLTHDLDELLQKLIEEGGISGGWYEPAQPERATLSVTPQHSTVVIPGTVNITLTVNGESDEGKSRSAYIVANSGNGPSPVFASSKITGSNSATITFNSEGLEEGIYHYTAFAGELHEDFEIYVNNFHISRSRSGFTGSIKKGHTYADTFQVYDAAGQVNWTLIDNTNGKYLHTAISGDLFIVEGIAGLAANTEAQSQSFIVNASFGGVTKTYGVNFNVEDENIDFSDEELEVYGDHENVGDEYLVMFPYGVTVDTRNSGENYIDLPIWLKPVYDEGYSYLIIGVEFAGRIGNLANGTSATVRICADDDLDGEDGKIYLGWDVVYNPSSAPSSGPSTPSRPTTPTSPDVQPTSPDVPPVTSPDNPPVISPDVPPVTSPDNPPVISPDVPPVVSPDVPPVISPDNPPVISPDVPPVVSPDTPPVEPVSPDTPPIVSPDTPVPGTTSDDEPVTPPETSPDVEPGNGGGGQIDVPGNEPPVEPVAVRPGAPRVNIQSQNIVNTILNAIRQSLTSLAGNTEVLNLNENATVGTERAPEDLTREELAGIPETETPAAVLPIITVQRPAVYVFGVTLNNLQTGARIFLHLMAEAIASSAEFQISADEVDGYTFLNDDGEEITTVPANKHVNIAAYMEPGKTYAPIITTEASSSGGGGSGDGGNGDNPASSVGSSSGGCNAGFSVIGLALLGLFASKRKK